MTDSASNASGTNGWTRDVEAIVLQFMEEALGWTFVHRREYEDRHTLHIILYSSNVVLTILSSIGTLVSQLYSTNYPWILYIFAGMTIIAAAIAIVDDQMLSLVETAAKHEECMRRWQVIPEHIKLELTKLPTKREPADDFTTHLEKDFRKIHSDQPFARSSVMKEWEALRLSYTNGKKRVTDASQMSLLSGEQALNQSGMRGQLPFVTGALRASAPKPLAVRRVSHPLPPNQTELRQVHQAGVNQAGVHQAGVNHVPNTEHVVSQPSPTDNIAMDSGTLSDVYADIGQNAAAAHMVDTALESIRVESGDGDMAEHFTGGAPSTPTQSLPTRYAFTMTPENFLRNMYQ